MSAIDTFGWVAIGVMFLSLFASLHFHKLEREADDLLRRMERAHWDAAPLIDTPEKLAAVIEIGRVRP